MRHTAAKALAAVAFTAALTTVAAVPAMADPAALPAAKDIVGVGSDTTQALFTKFSADYNATIPAGDTTTPRLYSWDATGTSPITPKAGGSTIARPNGSGAGIGALNTTTKTTLDFARSSRAAQATDPTGLDFIAFAKDAVTWSAVSGGHAPANLTTANLVDIYTCAKTNWSQFGGTAGTIQPFLPQSGSGTRSFFLQALGNITPGSCVVSGPEENEGTDPLLLTNVDAVIPYSVGHYVGQLNGHTTATDAPGNLTLRNLNGVSPLTATNTLNPAFAGGSFGRVLFNVVRDADYTAATTQGTALRNIFSNTGWICSTAGRNDISSFGFLNLPTTGCGVIIH